MDAGIRIFTSMEKAATVWMFAVVLDEVPVPPVPGKRHLHEPGQRAAAIRR